MANPVDPKSLKDVVEAGLTGIAYGVTMVGIGIKKAIDKVRGKGD